MEIKYNVTGDKRKSLVGAISQELNAPMKYLGAPTFAYKVGGYTIDKNGTVSFDVMTDSEETEKLLEALGERGFNFESPDRLVIELPREGFTDEAISNLRKLVDSKGNLIKKAISADNLPIEQTEETLRFPWFNFDSTPEEVSAYARFVGALCTMAKTLQRVSASPKEVDNEKYAFRCFLLRMGFIGPEYKNVRKVLLANLTGNSAFRNGKEASE